MRIEIYYQPEERRWADIISGFVKGLCGNDLHELTLHKAEKAKE